MKKLIIYDLDGTLVDTRQDICRSVQHMLKRMGADVLEPSEIIPFVGRGVHFLIGGCLKTEDVKEIERGIKIYREHYSIHMLDHSSLYPGALEMLELLKGRDQAVVTNKPNPYSRDILTALKVEHFFKRLIAGDHGVSKKPDPGPVLEMMRDFGVGKGEVVFVGDSLIDIETARNADIEVHILTHGFGALNEIQSASPDGVFNHFEELIKHARAKGW